jgi:hypothetical protein
MLFSDIPPCTNITAGIELNVLCDFLLSAGHTVSCFIVKHRDISVNISADKADKINLKTVQKPRENWGTIKPLGAIASLLGNNFVRFFKLPSIIKQAARFAKDNKADLIWSVVQGQSLIWLTKPVATYAGLPYILQTWDPPEWWMMENKVDGITKRFVLKEFGRSVHDCRCFIAASWAMEKEYKKLYNCRLSIPLILGFSPERPKASGQKNASDFVIALSGQIYAVNEFAALISALDEMGWHYNGRRIILRLYGRYFHLYFSEASHIEIRGWLNQKELLSELCDADLLYCPYWFDPLYEKPARLSFPSKLSTYLKVPVPVMFHGPAYASPYIFLEEHNAAYLCNTLDPSEISAQIKDIMDEKNNEYIIERAYNAFLNNLTLDKMRESFLSAIECK